VTRVSSSAIRDPLANQLITPQNAAMVVINYRPLSRPDYDERINRMPDAKELLHSNLHEVFSERDPERRRLAIERTYTEDVTFIDPEGEFVGRQALSDQAQKLLDGVLAGFVFEEDGPRYVGTDAAAPETDA
jgi:hypothetical protein